MRGPARSRGDSTLRLEAERGSPAVAPLLLQLHLGYHYSGLEHLHIGDGSAETRDRAANHVDSAAVRYAIGFSPAHDDRRVRSPGILRNVVHLVRRQRRPTSPASDD